MSLLDAPPAARLKYSFDAGAYGAKFDATTDDGAAIQAALNAAGALIILGGGGAEVVCPMGIAMTSIGLTVPARVQLRGQNKRATIIKANTSWAGGGPLVRIGAASDNFAAHDSLISDLTIHCNDRPNSTALYSGHANEGSGLSRVGLRNYITYGARFDKSDTVFAYGNGNFACFDIECAPSASTTASVGILIKDATGNNDLRRVTLVPIDGSSTAGHNNDGILIDNSDVHISSVHAEAHGNVVRSTNGATVVLSGANGDPTDDCLLKIDSGSGMVVGTGLRAVGATACVIDSAAGRTITASTPVYVAGVISTRAGDAGQPQVSKMHRSNNQTIPTGVLTGTIYDTIDRDDSGGGAGFNGFSTQSAGWYEVSAGVAFATSTAGVRRLARLELGSTPFARVELPPGGTGALTSMNMVGSIYISSAAQAITVKVLQDTGGNLDLDPNTAGLAGSWLVVKRVGD